MFDGYSLHDKLYVAVDSIVFGFDGKQLKILLAKRTIEPEKNKWSLLAAFLRKNETLQQAAQRGLKRLTGLQNVHLKNVHAFSEVDRDPAERTISIAYYGIVNIKKHKKELVKKYSAKWFPINDFPDLIFDHNDMVEKALERLRHRASVRPVGKGLLPEKFEILQLQNLYEAIFAKKLDNRNFRKKIASLDLLIKLNEKNMASSKKGSFLYEFDKLKYDIKLDEGHMF